MKNIETINEVCEGLHAINETLTKIMWKYIGATQSKLSAEDLKVLARGIADAQSTIAIVNREMATRYVLANGGYNKISGFHDENGQPLNIGPFKNTPPPPPPSPIAPTTHPH